MKLVELLTHNAKKIQSVLPEHLRYRGIVRFDVSEDNPIFAEATDPNKALADYLNMLENERRQQILISGYGEKRVLYQQAHFANRCIHLGIDIPLPAGTEIVCPLAARIHSFADNQRDGDYGPTLILQHELDQHIFYSLYGHLSRTDLPTWHEGQPFAQGAVIGHIGASSENGGWPPHLHLQLIDQIGQYQGDYPGVCRPEEAEHYLNNCPNPEGLIIAS